MGIWVLALRRETALTWLCIGPKWIRQRMYFAASQQPLKLAPAGRRKHNVPQGEFCVQCPFLLHPAHALLSLQPCRYEGYDRPQRFTANLLTQSEPQIEPRYQKLVKVIQAVGYHSYTLWLFTLSDHKPLVYPMTVTGLLNLFAGPTFNAVPTHPSSYTTLAARLPAVIFWVWFNFLVFCLGNQRRPSSVSEDQLNKPWRPIPAGRISASSATALWVSLHFAVLLCCAYFGATFFTIALLVLGYMYNDLGGGEHPFTRNLINAAAVVFFALGATTVAFAGHPLLLTQQATQWQYIIGAIVFTTLQVQDLHDQEGDRDRGRSTIPIVYGDFVARWSVIVPMLTWSIAVPLFWNLPAWGYVGPVGIGGTICARAAVLKGVAADRKTYKMWGLWISCLLASPAVAACT